MKTKNLNLLMIFTFAFFLIIAGNKTYAQCQHGQQQQQQQQVNPNDGPKCGKGCVKGLTDDQKKQIDVLKQKMMKEVLPLKNQIAEKKAHLNTLSSGDNVDISAINKTIDELFLLKAEVAKKQQIFRQDVRKLLNDEQKIEFDMHQGKGMKCGKGKACEKNPGMGQGDGKTGCNKGADKPPCCKSKEGAEDGSQNPGCNHQK
jgi:Spy/CpxP family protein refolding chaperone